MLKRDMEWVLNQIAEREHTTAEAVRREMIAAMDDAQKHCDPAVKELWNSIPRKGDKLTPEELIEYLTMNKLS